MKPETLQERAERIATAVQAGFDYDGKTEHERLTEAAEKALRQASGSTVLPWRVLDADGNLDSAYSDDTAALRRLREKVGWASEAEVDGPARASLVFSMEPV